MKCYIVLLILISPILAEEELIINQHADHSIINSVFVITLNSNDAEGQMWEKKLLEVGYNVLSRDKIEVLFEEHQLAMSGLTNSIKIGELVGADAVLFVDSKVNDNDSPNNFAQNVEIKLISISTGEILMIGEYIDTGNPADVLASGEKWFNEVLVNYHLIVSKIR